VAALLLAPAALRAADRHAPVAVSPGVAPFPAATGPSAWNEGEAIVVLRAGAAPDRDALAAAGLRVERTFRTLSRSQGRPYLLVKSDTLSTVDLLARLHADARVAKAWPNYLVEAFETPASDPLFDLQWGLHNTGQTVGGAAGTPDADIDAPEAWARGTGSPGVVVAVVDSGVDLTHEDLAANLWTNTAELHGAAGVDDDGNGYVDDVHGIETLKGWSNPMDNHGHGTHVAGIIAAAADNGLGVVGVAPDVRIMALKGLDSEGRGTDAALIECIEYAVAMKAGFGVNVVAINASWGSPRMVHEDGPVRDAIAAAGAAGIVFVAAAGNFGFSNDGDGVRVYPASYDLDSIIAVAASDPDDRQAGFSSFGRANVDLAAPGVDILSSVPGGGYEPGRSGTDLFFDDLESGGAAWVHGGRNDRWSLGTDAAGTIWTADARESTAMETDSWLMPARDLDLSGETSAVVTLAFRARIELGAAATLALEISADGGLFWWRLAALPSAAGWSSYAFTVPFLGQTSRFRFRFRLRGSADDPGQSLAIDDVGVGTAPSRDFAYSSGTSMAAPHVAGALALAASLFPEESLLARINRIFSGADGKEWLEGSLRTGGRLNVGNAVQPDLPLRPWLMSADSAGSGGPVAAGGVGFGGAPGEAIFSTSAFANHHTSRFLFKFQASGRDNWIAGTTFIDDVRVWSDAREYFADGMESGEGKWVHGGGACDAWTLTGDESHDGPSSWTLQRCGYDLDVYFFSPLMPAAEIDLSDAGDRTVRLSFWVKGGIVPGDEWGDEVSVWISDRGTENFVKLADVWRNPNWSSYELTIPGSAVENPGEVVSWSDTALRVVPPPGAGKHLRIRGATGRTSLEQAVVSAWEARAPSARQHVGGPTVAWRGRLYRFGGGDERWVNVPRDFTVTEVYDPATDAWRISPRLRLPRPRAQHAAVTLGSRVYLVGGLNPVDDLWEARREVDSIDLRTGVRRREARLPQALGYPLAVALNGKLLVLGWTEPPVGTPAELLFLEYSPRTRAWKRKTWTGPPEFWRGSLVPLGGLIYVFGGVDLEGRALPPAVLDPATGAWTPLPEPPLRGLMETAAATDGRRIYLAGGRRDPQLVPTDAFQVYDTVPGEWLGTAGSIDELRSTREGGQLSFVPGRGLFLTGGRMLSDGNYPTVSDRHERLDVGHFAEAGPATRATPGIAAAPAR
jgi:subtilisin family serine protease